MSFLSILVLFVAVINLTNIAGNPKQHVHAQPNPNGLINNQPPTIEPHTTEPDSQRPLRQLRSSTTPSPIRPAPVPIPPVPHIQPQGPPRPPPRFLR
ncbi:hypothetical protein P8452_30772 [Trifolium repens]|nr:hypothetical protein P8452_30772 [Trifolium repens]